MIEARFIYSPMSSSCKFPKLVVIYFNIILFGDIQLVFCNMLFLLDLKLVLKLTELTDSRHVLFLLIA